MPSVGGKSNPRALIGFPQVSQVATHEVCRASRFGLRSAALGAYSVFKYSDSSASGKGQKDAVSFQAR